MTRIGFAYNQKPETAVGSSATSASRSDDKPPSIDDAFAEWDSATTIDAVASALSAYGTAIRLDWFPTQVNTVVLALDADVGGKQATARLIERLEQADIHTQVCPPPQDRWGKDWSERWRTMGPESMVPLLEVRSSLRSEMRTQMQGA